MATAKLKRCLECSKMLPRAAFDAHSSGYLKNSCRDCEAIPYPGEEPAKYRRARLNRERVAAYRARQAEARQQQETRETFDALFG